MYYTHIGDTMEILNAILKAMYLVYIVVFGTLAITVVSVFCDVLNSLGGMVQ